MGSVDQGLKASWSPPSLSINSRVQSKASILCLDAHDQENVKYHFQWKICSILNHPDPPLKYSDGCWVCTTRLRKTLAKHLFHKKVGILQKHFFGNVLLKKSPSSVASRCCSTTHPKKNCRESQCHHSFSIFLPSQCKRQTWVKPKFAGIDIHLATCSWSGWPLHRGEVLTQLKGWKNMWTMTMANKKTWNGRWEFFTLLYSRMLQIPIQNAIS